MVDACVWVVDGGSVGFFVTLGVMFIAVVVGNWWTVDACVVIPLDVFIMTEVDPLDSTVVGLVVLSDSASGMSEEGGKELVTCELTQ